MGRQLTRCGHAVRARPRRERHAHARAGPQVLRSAKVPGVEGMRLQSDLSAVAEVFNVLYAGHEIVSRTTTLMLDWFETWEPPPPA